MSQQGEQLLVDAMRELAKTHERGAELQEKATELEAALDGTGSVLRLIGAWARARKLWCDCTGDALV